MLTLEKSKELLAPMVTQTHLIHHATAVMAAMGAMAEHFNEDKDNWQAIGYLHDYDYEKYPDEHLQHTKDDLEKAGVLEEEIRTILSHGYGMCSDVEPLTNRDKSLYTVDELTGIIQACSKMRPNGITDLEVKSVMKKFKDKNFAAGCKRDVILNGCEMLNMSINEVIAICLEGMKPFAKELNLLPKE